MHISIGSLCHWRNAAVCLLIHIGLANVYHGLDGDVFTPAASPTADYILYLGRIIEPKGLHLAIEAVRKYNADNPQRTIKLKIAGKHYGRQGYILERAH